MLGRFHCRIVAALLSSVGVTLQLSQRCQRTQCAAKEMSLSRATRPPQRPTSSKRTRMRRAKKCRRSGRDPRLVAGPCRQGKRKRGREEGPNLMPRRPTRTPISPCPTLWMPSISPRPRSKKPSTPPSTRCMHEPGQSRSADREMRTRLQTNALRPVNERPTINVFISRVPSYE